MTFRSPHHPKPTHRVDPPADVTAERRPPLHIETHGGGFVSRNVHEDAHICRFLASDVGCVVLSIDYHCAPQVTFPVAEEECFDVLR